MESLNIVEFADNDEVVSKSKTEREEMVNELKEKYLGK